jgi:hypothetical protein
MVNETGGARESGATTRREHGCRTHRLRGAISPSGGYSKIAKRKILPGQQGEGVIFVLSHIAPRLLVVLLAKQLLPTLATLPKISMH